ncbi:MAG: hypothetical protein V3T58_02645 [Candidatus Hydrothermarchaeales archaeon]
MNKRQREYLAESLSKISEYLVSIVILGQIVSGRVNLFMTIMAGILFALSLAMGTFILGKIED